MLQSTKMRASFAGLMLLHATLAAPTSFGQTDSPQRLKALVQELHAKGERVIVTMPDKAEIRGTIIRIGDDSFAIRKEKSVQETLVPFAQVKQIRKAGSSGRKKALLITAAIAGGAFLVLCAAPYPLGFLCRKDPS